MNDILVEQDGEVTIVTLNRPKQLNALNNQLMDELGAALKAFDADPAIGCMIVTGSEKAFAAGADIGAMATYSFADVYKGDYITRNWETIRSVRKPVIAAVSGFALGGGCELAMMCDFMIAADNAKFGQPEIKIGIIPGAGGTQRLPSKRHSSTTRFPETIALLRTLSNCGAKVSPSHSRKPLSSSSSDSMVAATTWLLTGLPILSLVFSIKDLMLV